jgi:hypothetical protein
MENGKNLKLGPHEKHILQVLLREHRIEFGLVLNDNYLLWLVKDHLVDVSEVTEYVVDHGNINGEML